MDLAASAGGDRNYYVEDCDALVDIVDFTGMNHVDEYTLIIER